MIYHNIDNINALKEASAVTVGMFDGVHVGHRHLLRLLHDEAERRQLHPYVVTFDRHPKLALGGHTELLMGFDVRVRTLEALGFDVVVVPFTPQTASLSACAFAREVLCNQLGMQLLVLGYDNRFGNRQHNDFDCLEALGKEVGFGLLRDEAVAIEGITVSSTQVRLALQEGQVELAQRFLGQPYSISGTVVAGRRVGRQIGFPTANVQVENLLLPLEGAYAVRATVEGLPKSLEGMVNIGPQPTFGQEAKTVEVNLFGDCGDIYGRHISLAFAGRLRGIQKFDSPEALANQLLLDKQQSYDLLR